MFRAFSILPMLALTACGTAQGAGKVTPDAVAIMKPDQWPELYAKLGKAAFDRANALSPRAAKVAALRGTCDEVNYVGISFWADSQELNWYADCTNGAREVVREAELG